MPVLIALAGMDDLPTLEELLKISVFQWSRLGEELGISEETLRDIESRHPHNEAECRRKMFAAWLQADRDVSRTTIINALRAMDDNPSADWYEAYTKRLQHKPRARETNSKPNAPRIQHSVSTALVRLI